MNTGLRNIILLISIMLLTGCVTVNSVESEYTKINYQDGVSEQEAMTIVRKKLIDSGFYKTYPLWLVVSSDEGEYWRIVCSSLDSYIFSKTCVFIIEKINGEIIIIYKAGNSDETFDGRRPHRSIEEWKKNIEEWERIEL